MKNLTTKLVKIMSETKRVAKNGRNDFHKYDYVTEADVLEAVRENLIKHNVFVYSSVVSSHKDADLTSVQMKHTLVDGDSGEAIEVFSLGQGQDKGDKGSNKAITSAIKYFLMKNLLIPTGDDVEATDADGKTTGSVKAKATLGLAQTGGGGGVSSPEGDKPKAYGFSARTKAAPKAKAPEAVDEF